MIPETVHFALALTLAIALVQSVLPILGPSRGDLEWMRSARTSALAQLVFIGHRFRGPHGTNGTRKISRKLSNGGIGFYNEQIVEVFDRTSAGTHIKLI